MFRAYLFMAIPVILQIICIVHVVRKGCGTGWIYVIVFLPVAGCIAYFIIEILPELRSGGVVDNLKDTINNVVVPGKKLKDLEQKLHFSDTFDNRMKLADEYSRCGLYRNAIEIYEKFLDGIYGDDPMIIYKISLAYYNELNYVKAMEFVIKLASKDMVFKNFNEWKLYVMLVEQKGDVEATLKEYDRLAENNPNFEAIYLYGKFLKKIGKTREAAAKFNDILFQGNQIKEYSFHDNKKWIGKAKSEMKSMTVK
jgi:hypothetical protein